jgi:hypothetical protein
MAGREGRQKGKAGLATRNGRQERRTDGDRMHQELMARSMILRSRAN